MLMDILNRKEEWKLMGWYCSTLLPVQQLTWGYFWFGRGDDRTGGGDDGS